MTKPDLIRLTIDLAMIEDEMWKLKKSYKPEFESRMAELRKERDLIQVQMEKAQKAI